MGKGVELESVFLHYLAGQNVTFQLPSSPKEFNCHSVHSFIKLYFTLCLLIFLQWYHQLLSSLHLPLDYFFLIVSIIFIFHCVQVLVTYIYGTIQTRFVSQHIMYLKLNDRTKCTNLLHTLVVYYVTFLYCSFLSYAEANLASICLRPHRGGGLHASSHCSNYISSSVASPLWKNHPFAFNIHMHGWLLSW